MISDVVNDQMHISCAGVPNIGASTTIKITLPEDWTLHDIRSYAIAFKLTLTGTAGAPSIFNALTLF